MNPLLLGLPGLALLLAVGAALSARCGPWPVRGLGLVAVLLAAAGALDPARVERREHPPRVQRVATGTPVPGLLRAALRAGPRAGELVLEWGGPLPGDGPLAADGGGLGGRALVADLAEAPLSVQPEEVVVVPARPPRVGRPVELEVHAPEAAAGLAVTVVVRRSAAVPLEEEVRLGDRGRAALPWTPEDAGEHELVLRWQDGGREVVRRGRLAVAEPPAVLAVGPAAGQVAELLGVQGQPVRAEPDVPGSLEDVGVVVATGALDEREAARLRRFAEDGGGLLLLGEAMGGPGGPLHEVLPVRLQPRDEAGEGGEGHGSGGEPPEEPPDTPPEDPPPDETPPDEPPKGDTTDAEIDPSEPVETERRLVAVVLVVDRSMSMGVVNGATGRTPLDYAKVSAFRTAEALQEGDRVGLVTFAREDMARIALPITPATETDAVRERVEAVRATGDRTYLASGLELAGRLLDGVTARVKHVVVLSDGELMDSDIVLGARARELADGGATVSLIYFGGHESPHFVAKARAVTDAGKGRFVRAPGIDEVPRLVFAEVVRALDRVGREPAIRSDGTPRDSGPPPEEPPDAPDTGEEEPPGEPPPSPPPEDAGTETPAPGAELTVRAIGDAPVLQPMRREWPPVRGVRGCDARLDARVHLVAGERGVPLLAGAHRGLGTVMVWTSDLFGPWGRAWREDAGFPGRFAQWVTALQPAPDAAPEAMADGGWEVDRRVPTPAESAALERWTYGATTPPAELPPRTEWRHASTAVDRSLWVLLALAVLAGAEWLARRLAPAAGV